MCARSSRDQRTSRYGIGQESSTPCTPTETSPLLLTPYHFGAVVFSESSLSFDAQNSGPACVSVVCTYAGHASRLRNVPFAAMTNRHATINYQQHTSTNLLMSLGGWITRIYQEALSIYYHITYWVLVWHCRFGCRAARSQRENLKFTVMQRQRHESTCPQSH